MIAYFDMFSGISGDMTLGALMDLGVPADWLRGELSRVLTGFRLKTSQVYQHHLKATDVVVDGVEEDPVSRNYKEIKTLIENSSLPEKVKVNSLSAFKKIAEAESIIHGKDIETIHFHEIGGIDSLVDIIGSFLCVGYLGIHETYASCIPLGSGVVSCAHGTIPVPVPATMAILKGIPVISSDATTEIVTPTGAAIIATLATSFGNMPEMILKQVGYGSGKRETGSNLPNLLRIVLGEATKNQKKHGIAVQKETICVVKTNVDDMNPEVSGFLMEILFEHKALDVCYSPVQMKKNRPGLQIEVMCQKADVDKIVHIILTQTPSIGVRYHECERAFLLRETVEVETVFGKLQVKKITNPDNSIRFVPEYEVAKKVAKEKKMPLKDVYQQISCDANLLDPISLTGIDTEYRTAQ
ncbi:nickel pincer cofactor biosynthesis protein LarC [Desulfobacula sp.]|uniref:nickel pincer cofactor biosynthesis protein LarC n=1 Tax=Desulfobacula sp. TaxID=2593537 RepID=UPI002624A8DA|nr:nickel pincer cofactor biosynthesis protein LarC [Desulfobacula sp.]